eukprot:1379411-Rhodomonas_salina.1
MTPGRHGHGHGVTGMVTCRMVPQAGTVTPSHQSSRAQVTMLIGLVCPIDSRYKPKRISHSVPDPAQCPPQGARSTNPSTNF